MQMINCEAQRDLQPRSEFTDIPPFYTDPERLVSQLLLSHTAS